MADGKLTLAFAHTEARRALRPRARRDARATRTAAATSLDGDKRVVLHGAVRRPAASCRRAPRATTPIATASALFLVDRAAPGVTLHARTARSTACAPPTSRFDGVRVAADALIGAEGDALPLIEEVVDFATALLCAEAVGAISYANDATLEYLKTRKQFGVPIGTFQALQHRMVDMVIELRAGAVDGEPRVRERSTRERDAARRAARRSRRRR